MKCLTVILSFMLMTCFWVESKIGVGMLGQMTPYFTVSSANLFIEFMSVVFGTVTIKRDYGDDGSFRHARLQLGESMIMLNEANSDYEVNKSQMHVYVTDVEKTYELALTNNAKSLMSPMVRPHGDLMAGFEDPCGNVWWIAAKV